MKLIGKHHSRPSINIFHEEFPDYVHDPTASRHRRRHNGIGRQNMRRLLGGGA